jgi:acyl-CoA thioesterase
MPAMHPLDSVTALTALGDSRYRCRTNEFYANWTGPFGGFTAAALMRAVMEHPKRHGDPVALTVNFCSPIADGEFEISLKEMRTGRSTQHWSLELTQGGAVAATASVVCGSRRDVWSHCPTSPPDIPPPEQVPHYNNDRHKGWLRQYDMRFREGEVDFEAPAGSPLRSPRSVLWMRDAPARPLDFISLACMSDAFIIRSFVARGQFSPVGTVTMTTFFHGDEAALKAQGTDYVLGMADANIFAGGFADQKAELWGRDGRLLATSTQIVWYKE